MKKTYTTPSHEVQGTKLTTADWKESFSEIDFHNLDNYDTDFLNETLDKSWKWFLSHQLCMSVSEVERYLRARKAVQNNLIRRI